LIGSVVFVQASHVCDCDIQTDRLTEVIIA